MVMNEMQTSSLFYILEPPAKCFNESPAWKPSMEGLPRCSDGIISTASDSMKKQLPGIEAEHGLAYKLDPTCMTQESSKIRPKKGDSSEEVLFEQRMKYKH